MRNRCFRLAVAFAAGVISACSDAAVNQVTAPRIAATPATPVAEMWPYWFEYTSEMASAIGIQIALNQGFDAQGRTFTVDAHVTFQWANDVSVSVTAWLLNKSGQTINRGNSDMTWKRIALPVASADTTFSVSISTNNTTCGLIGKASYSGSAAQVALDFRLMQITLYHQSISGTGEDVTQPACPPPSGCTYDPATRVVGSATSALAAETISCSGGYPIPPGGGDEEYWTCVTLWRELWVWNYLAQLYSLEAEWLIGSYCYSVTVIT